MKVKQLIAKLQKTDQNRIVVLSSDSEGNSFEALGDISESAYNAERGELGLEKLRGRDISLGYSEEDVMTDGKPAVVLWP